MFQVFQMTKGESSDELILGEPSAHDETRSVKRRNRVLLSCIPCHELRRKCDRQRPCTRCSDHGVAGQCVYQLEDPALRSSDQDELTRLRRRVLELEHTVRVLTQRHSPREAFDEKVLQPGSSRPQGSAEHDVKGKKPGSSSGNVPGQTRPASLPGQSTPPHGSPSSVSGNVDNCGCALSSVGRQILTQLLTSLVESIQRLKTLPEHQRHNLNCQLYTQVIHLHHHILQAIGGNALPQAVYPGGAPQQSYALQSPYAPTASSHSSASPPQTLAGDFLTFNPNDPTFDLNTPAEPYPYNAPHSSTLAHTLSHTLSHPHVSSGTTSQGHSTLSYNLASIPGMSSSTTSYAQYQPAQPAQPAQQYAPAVPTMSRAGPSSSSQGSSLSTWNSMVASSTSTAQPLHRSTSKSTRSPNPRPAK